MSTSISLQIRYEELPESIQGYGLRVASYELRVTGYGLRVTNYGLRVNRLLSAAVLRCCGSSSIEYSAKSIEFTGFIELLELLGFVELLSSLSLLGPSRVTSCELRVASYELRVTG